MPPAVIITARPVPPRCRTSRARTTSPTDVTPMHSTTPAEDQSSTRTSGRAATSRTPARASANKDAGGGAGRPPRTAAVAAGSDAMISAEIA